jgi:hypothetical protein
LVYNSEKQKLKIMKTLDKLKHTANVAANKMNETATDIARKINETSNVTVQKIGETAQSMQETITNVTKNELILQIIQQATKINYNAISMALGKYPIPKKVLLSIDILQKATHEYQQSSSLDKGEKFLNCIVNNINAKMVLETLVPIAGMIPVYEPVIILVLKLIIKLKKT